MYRILIILMLLKYAQIVEQEPSTINCLIGLIAIIAGVATWLFILSKIEKK